MTEQELMVANMFAEHLEVMYDSYISTRKEINDPFKPEMGMLFDLYGSNYDLDFECKKTECGPNHYCITIDTTEKQHDFVAIRVYVDFFWVEYELHIGEFEIRSVEKITE